MTYKYIPVASQIKEIIVIYIESSVLKTTDYATLTVWLNFIYVIGRYLTVAENLLRLVAEFIWAAY